MCQLCVLLLLFIVSLHPTYTQTTISDILYLVVSVRNESNHVTLWTYKIVSNALFSHLWTYNSDETTTTKTITKHTHTHTTDRKPRARVFAWFRAFVVDVVCLLVDIDYGINSFYIRNQLIIPICNDLMCSQYSFATPNNNRQKFPFITCCIPCRVWWWWRFCYLAFFSVSRRWICLFFLIIDEIEVAA